MTRDAQNEAHPEDTGCPDSERGNQGPGIVKSADYSAESSIEFGYVKPAVIAYCDHVPPSVCSAELRAIGYQMREMGDPRWVDVLIQSAKNI